MHVISQWAILSILFTCIVANSSRNVIMSDENKNRKASTAMPASDCLKHSVSLDRRIRRRPININFNLANNDYSFVSISPRSEPSLDPCPSRDTLSRYERAAIPRQPFLTPSLSMSSLQQHAEEGGYKTSARHSRPHHHSTLSPSFSMSSLVVEQGYRPRSLMESILIAKMEKANTGGSSSINGYSTPPNTKSLLRTDSLGSTGSFTSNSSLSSDYCRCDDCLLGIVDLNVNLSQRMRLKKPSSWRKLRNIVQRTPFFQIYKKQRYPWVQLAGHQENFRAGPKPGTILKKLCPKEQICFQVLMKDPLKSFVPEYKGFITTDDGELYLQLQDLLSEFSSPCVMDCKIGIRTYLEEELAKAKEKPKLRKDMYEKMIQIDPTSLTEEEQRLKGVTKPRYMIWRETISSTSTLGFRIEGIRKNDGKSSKDFKTTKTRRQIIEALEDFMGSFPNVLEKYMHRLKKIKKTLLMSKFFATHEVIGSSMLFVHDDNNANIWLIDFAKTIILPSDLKISHDKEWTVGNHEDGYLIGLNNLMDVFNDVYKLKSNINNRQTESINSEVT